MLARGMIQPVRYQDLAETQLDSYVADALDLILAVLEERLPDEGVYMAELSLAAELRAIASERLLHETH